METLSLKTQVSHRKLEQGADQPETLTDSEEPSESPGRIATLIEEDLHVIRTHATAL